MNIFIIKMEVWKIGDSKPAPKFQIICSPNDWARTVKDTVTGNKLTDTNLLQLDYWTEFNSYMGINYSWFKGRKPQPQLWYDVAIGSSQVHISLTVSFSKSFIRCELYIPDNKELFHKLNEQKDNIEKELGLTLTWQELPKAKASTITIAENKPKIKMKETWDNCFTWYGDIVKRFTDVFPKYF